MNELLPPASLRARVLEAARREPAPPRAVGVRRRALSAALGFGAFLAIAAIVRPHAGARPPAYLAFVGLSWLAVAVVGTWASLDRGSSMLGRSPRWKALATASVPFALLVTWFAASRAYPETLSASATPAEDARCVLMTFALAAGPLAAFAWMRRRSDPGTPGLTGAAFGAAAAGWAAVALFVLCDHASASHMIVGHLVPVLIVAGVGTLVGVRWLGLRPVGGRARVDGPRQA